MSFDLTAADPLMKIHFSPKIAKMHNTAAVIRNLVGEGNGIPISNRGYEIPIHLGPTTDEAWFDDGGTLPAGNGQVLTRSTALYKRFALAILFSGDALDATQNDAVAYAKSLAFNVKNATVDAIKRLNIYTFGDGSGLLGKAGTNNQDFSAGTATAFDVSGTSDGSRYIRKGMKLDIHDGVTSTILGTVVVNSVDSATQITVTKVSGSGLNDIDIGDAVYIQGAYNKVIAGLDLLIDNTDVAGGVQGIDRGDFPEWNANVISLSGSPALSRDHLRRAIAAIQISRGSVDMGSLVIVSHPAQLHAYMDMGWPLQRFQMGSGAKKLDLGFTAYEWEGIPWVIDTDAPKDKIYFLDKSSLFKVTAKSLGFDDRSGNVLKQVPSATAGRYDDQYVAYLIARENMGIYEPNANTKVKGLAVPSGY